MNIHFALLDGTEQFLKVKETITIGELKQLLEKTTRIYWKRMNLIFCGKCLLNQKTIKESNIKSETTIHVIYIDEQEYWQEQYKDSISNKDTKLKEQTPEYTSLWSAIFSHCCCEERTPQTYTLKKDR